MCAGQRTQHPKPTLPYRNSEWSHSERQKGWRMEGRSEAERFVQTNVGCPECEAPPNSLRGLGGSDAWGWGPGSSHPALEADSPAHHPAPPLGQLQLLLPTCLPIAHLSVHPDRCSSWTTQACAFCHPAARCQTSWLRASPVSDNPPPRPLLSRWDPSEGAEDGQTPTQDSPTVQPLCVYLWRTLRVNSV